MVLMKNLDLTMSFVVSIKKLSLAWTLVLENNCLLPVRKIGLSEFGTIKLKL